ncbi:hypothetical protein PTI98_011127 [Pleurotus ostreatus]|nr:hypothetical protein PTI98_011127 [Pleurotus ostreatus]
MPLVMAQVDGLRPTMIVVTPLNLLGKQNMAQLSQHYGSSRLPLQLSQPLPSYTGEQPTPSPYQRTLLISSDGSPWLSRSWYCKGTVERLHQGLY